jgi:hypothetical protein
VLRQEPEEEVASSSSSKVVDTETLNCLKLVSSTKPIPKRYGSSFEFFDPWLTSNRQRWSHEERPPFVIVGREPEYLGMAVVRAQKVRFQADVVSGSTSFTEVIYRI